MILFTRIIAKKLNVCLIFFFLCFSPLFGFDADELFRDDTQGIVEEAPEADETGTQAASSVDVSALTKSSTQFAGKLNLVGGFYVGLLDYPADVTVSSLRSHIEGSALYDMKSTFTLNARPAANLRYHATATINLNTDTLVFEPALGSIYVDYTFLGKYFFRVGKHSTTWGQAQMLANPGNLVSGMDTNVAIRSFVPFGLVNVTSIVYAHNNSGVTPSNLFYALQLENQFSNGIAGVSMRFRANDSEPKLHSALYGKSAFLSNDIAFEFVSHIDTQSISQRDFAPLLENSDYFLLGNLYRENFFVLKQAGVEYLYTHKNSTNLYKHNLSCVFKLEQGYGVDIVQWTQEYALATGYSSSLAFAFPRIQGWRTGLTWSHAFYDTSGEILFGAQKKIEELDVKIAVPFVYGQEGTYYRKNNNLLGNGIAEMIVGVELGLSF